MQQSNKARSVLVVEDDECIQDALKDLLEDEGYRVSCAANGETALGMLRSASDLPGVILLDLMMPGMDGFQFRAVQELDSRLGRIPVILMTADGYIESKTMKIGAASFIKKPLDADDVLRKIERHFHEQATPLR